jgi:hypothetical protein
MRDVTNIFDHHRVSVRQIWNTAFWPDPDLRDWDSVDRFDEVQRILFDELVLGKTARDFPREDIFRVPIPFFRIVPSNESAPIMIQNPRAPNQTGYWDHPVNRLSPNEAEMHFVSYFDWNRLDYADFRYYHAVLARFDARPELVGREALIDRQHACVQLMDE